MLIVKDHKSSTGDGDGRHSMGLQEKRRSDLAEVRGGGVVVWRPSGG